MFDYKTACEFYRNNRRWRDVYIGIRLRHNVFMKYDPVEDCFVVSEVVSSLKCMSDPEPGSPKYERFVRLPTSLWTMRPYAKVYNDYTEIIAIVPNRYLKLFDVFHTAPRTIKTSGRIWYYKGQLAVSDVPIVLKDDVLTVLKPPKVRVIDPEKQKEMNYLIQSVRNMIKVRDKLGAFAKATPMHIAEYARQTGNIHNWLALKKPAKFVELLKSVTPENLESFYPLLWLSCNGYNNHLDAVTRYNGLINRMREKLRRELGVVSYVEPE